MEHLALYGGRAVRSRPFPRWPIFGLRERVELLRVLNSRSWGTLGPRTARFEAAFAKYLGSNRCIAVANGTVSLEIILRALDIGPGDEVIIPAYTFIATATAVLMVGATPVFADIDLRFNTIDPASVEAAISPRTRAIMPVHVAGFPADMDRLLTIGDARGLPVIEDAAQAHGSAWRGRKLGTLGAAGSFSFQLSKNMTAGEGGAIVTNDDDLAERAWSIHHVGRRKNGVWYGHYELASNYRITDWQSAVLLAQLGRLDAQNEQRERAVRWLNTRLRQITGIETFERDERATSITHHLYMFRISDDLEARMQKDEFVRALSAEGVPASSGYVEIQKQPLFAHESVRRILPEVDVTSVRLPQTERACRTTVWLPQNLLLGGERDLADIVRAVEKVASHAYAGARSAV